MQCSPEEGWVGPNSVRPSWSLFTWLIDSPLKLSREPLVDKAKVSAKDTVKLKKPRTKEAHRPPNQNGIDMFFQKTIESNSDRRTLEPAKPPDDVGFPNPVPHSEIVKPTAAKPRMTKPLTVVDPPTFLPIRTTTDTTGFLHRLKVREFVLQCIPQPLLFNFSPL